MSTFENNDHRENKSSGVAKAGLTLGIIGTGLGALLAAHNGDNGYGFFGNRANNVAEVEQSAIAGLESKIAELKGMRYTDMVGIDLYKNIITKSNEEDAKIHEVQMQLYNAIIDLDKRTALNTQAMELNRAYDNMAREYEMTILNNKINCCCDKANTNIKHNKELSELADSSIISYVNSNFLPGKLVLPASNICPPVQLQ